MRFVDSNVFVYAYYVTARQLSSSENKIKNEARHILGKINRGEKVTTSVVHLSEVSNILKKCYSPRDLASLLKDIYALENIKIVPVSEKDYLNAIDLSEELEINVNDCLAVVLMESNNLKEIYTFDKKDFSKIEEIKIVL